MGTVTPPTTTGGTRQQVTFDASTLAIPPLDYRSTRLFGIPLPPPLKIEIIPKRLQGFVDTETGETSLSFDAEFCFSVGSLYKVWHGRVCGLFHFVHSTHSPRTHPIPNTIIHHICPHNTIIHHITSPTHPETSTGPSIISGD